MQVLRFSGWLDLEGYTPPPTCVLPVATCVLVDKPGGVPSHRDANHDANRIRSIY